MVTVRKLKLACLHSENKEITFIILTIRHLTFINVVCNKDDVNLQALNREEIKWVSRG